MQFSIQIDSPLLIMHCHVIRSRAGHVVLSGTVRGQERLRCDMTTTYDKHPDRFAKECQDVAWNRLRQIAAEAA